MIEISPQGSGYLPEIPAKFFSLNLQSFLRHQDKGLGRDLEVEGQVSLHSRVVRGDPVLGTASLMA